MIDIEAEVKRHINCKDRGKLEKIINEYKSLALQYAQNFAVAGQYNKVALKLQELCDRLPAPKLKNFTSSAQNTQIKTASITSEENSRINAAWEQRAGSGVKRS